jgi:hypothetical protein
MFQRGRGQASRWSVWSLVGSATSKKHSQDAFVTEFIIAAFFSPPFSLLFFFFSLTRFYFSKYLDLQQHR